MKLNKLRKIIIESSIWLVLITFLVVSSVHLIDETFINKPKHIIKFRDVNGLIVGSPVYYAGVNIGHVSDVHLLENEAVVTFKIDRKDITLPRGTYANIEFKGLAGSKSIELFQSPVDSYEISSTETVRFRTLTKAYNNFMETIISISDFVLVAVKDVDESDVKVVLKGTRQVLADVQSKSQSVNKTLEETTQDFTKKTSEARRKLAVFGGFEAPDVSKIDLEKASKKVEEFDKKLPLSAKLKAFMGKFLPKTRKAKKEACNLSCKKREDLKKSLDNINEMTCSIYKFSKSAKENYNKNVIESLKCKVEEIKQQVIEMNNNMRVPDGNSN